MAGNFEIIVDDEGAVARVKGRTERVVERSKEIAEKGAQEGAAVMRFLAPRGTHADDDAETLHSRIDWSQATWHPGGAGGGGYWEAAAGVRRSPLHPDPDRDPAVLVARGTGLFGPYKTLIVPRSGNFLVFEKNGETVFTKHVKGQKPQRLWIDAARERANAVVASELAFLEATE